MLTASVHYGLTRWTPRRAPISTWRSSSWD